MSKERLFFQTEEQTQGGSWIYPIMASVIGWAAGAALLNRLAGSLKFFTGDDKLVFGDYSLMAYFLDLGNRFHQLSGALHGYSPQFMAGTPFSFVFNPYQFFQAIAAFTRFDVDTIVKLSPVLCLFVAPPLIYNALRNFGENRRFAFWGAISVMLWSAADLPLAFITFGMPSGFLLVYGSLYAISVCWRILDRQGPTPGFFVMLPIIFMTHKASALVIALPLFVFWIIYIKRTSLWGHIGLLLMAALTVAVNYFWIAPLVEHLPLREFLPGRLFWEGGRLAEFETMTGIPEYGAMRIFRAALIFLAIEGVFSWRSHRDHLKARAFFMVGALFALLIYGGESIEVLRPFYPKRFLPHFYILLFPAALEGVRLLGSYLLGKKRRGKISYVLPALALTALVIGPNYLKTTAGFPFMRRVSGDTHRLVDWVNSAAPGQGRVMIEDVGVFPEEPVYGLANIYGVFPGAILGRQTRAQFIGGPYPHIPLKTQYAGFGAGRGFDRPLSELNTNQLAELFENYNITRAAVFSDEAKELFGNANGLARQTGRIGAIYLYETTATTGWFFGATGEASAAEGTIAVSNLKPTEEIVVLKYHYSKRLKDPAGKVGVQPIKIGDDPVPFIRLVDPIENFVLTDY